jgi:hypothetical protein
VFGVYVNVVPSKLTEPFEAPENAVMLIGSPSGSLSFASSAVVCSTSGTPVPVLARSSRAIGARLSTTVIRTTAVSLSRPSSRTYRKKSSPAKPMLGV